MNKEQTTRLPVAERPKLVGLEVADQQLAEVKGPQDAIVWTRIRGEIQRQELERVEADRAARRDRSTGLLDFTREMIFLGAGVALIVTGHAWIGGFLAAAAAYPMAKDFVMEKFPKIKLPGSGD
jgi:hypothetical protein